MKEFVKNLLLFILGCFLIGYPIVLFYALWGCCLACCGNMGHDGKGPGPCMDV